MDRAAKYTCLQATFDFDLSFSPRFSTKSTLSLKELMSLENFCFVCGPLSYNLL